MIYNNYIYNNEQNIVICIAILRKFTNDRKYKILNYCNLWYACMHARSKQMFIHNKALVIHYYNKLL